MSITRRIRRKFEVQRGVSLKQFSAITVKWLHRKTNVAEFVHITSADKVGE